MQLRTKFSKDGKSFLYQVFMGIKAGVELADRYKRSFLNVQCNSIMVPAFFRDARDCSNNICRDTILIVSCVFSLIFSKPVQKDGEEMFVKDLQFRSIDWSTLRPHETEEDSLSTTSTIDYYRYTEEEYPSDEYDEDDERPTVRGEKSDLLRGESTGHESRNEWPDKDEWVASWKEAPPLSRLTWINVFTYYNKRQGYGGYGVILRNGGRKMENPFSYQVFMGIKAGVDLAEKHGRSLLSIHCNSLMVPALFGDARDCFNKKCIDTGHPNYICKRCERYFSGYRGWNRRLMVSLLVELRDKNIEELESAWSEAAHYLAKQEKKNKRTAPYDDDKPSDMSPDDFPQELKNILWRDAFASSDFMPLR
ncbi:hypothetical protein MKW98_008849 [Papaver atlanticum]|uniref:Uncharacterized protein n=1 Tax=Papaver atlanticum TaxID=357466 RepID=A0AAD4S7A3_9MAGN|nr:hypothetical protein MKW98_008849 [Papaver atlanticum]